MTFNDVIGNQNVKQHLLELMLQNRLPHALLFLGKEGSGALPLALAFAQLIICQPKSSPVVEDLFGGMSAISNEPSFLHPNDIESSTSYSKANLLVHPDLHFSFPFINKKNSDSSTISADYITEWREFLMQSPYGNLYDWLQVIKAENRQGNISAKECLEIIKKLSLKSFESDYKVLLMWLPELLSKEGNKLLKLIEEPPPNTIFIFVAENEEKILPTILSRCQLIKIPLPENDEVEEALLKKANIEPEQAKQIAAISNGNYREALHLIQHAEEDWQGLLRDWLNTIMRRLLPENIKWIEEISKIGREKQKQLLQYFNHTIEQALRLKTIGADNISLSESEKDFAQRFNKIANISQMQAISEELDKATFSIERNVNGKIVFTALSVKLYHILINKVVVEV